MYDELLSLIITIAILLGMGIWVPFLEFAAELVTSIRRRRHSAGRVSGVTDSTRASLQHYEVCANSSADAQTLYSLLINGSSWPCWTQIDSFELESGKVEDQKEAPVGAQGVGAVRVFRTGPYKRREKILSLISDRQMTYAILPGGMLLDYQATVRLTPVPAGGTDVRWQGSFRMFLPGFAWLMRLYLTCFMQRFVEGLARYAEVGTATKYGSLGTI